MLRVPLECRWLWLEVEGQPDALQRLTTAFRSALQLPEAVSPVTPLHRTRERCRS